MITWTRLVFPDGRELAMAFPSTDKNGAAGVEGNVHTNALGRIAGAVFQTALNAASFGLLNRATSGTVVVGVPRTIDSGRENPISSKMTVDAGERIQVYVAQPVDFL